MNNKLTFTAFLQDEYSKKFDQLANKTDEGIKDIEKDFRRLNKSTRQVGKSIEDLDKRINLLTRVRRFTLDTKAIRFATTEIKNLQREKERLEGMGSGRSGGSMSALNIATGIGIANVAGRGLSSIKSLVSGSADAFMNYEAVVQSFKVLTKDDAIGEGLANRLNKWQQDTILGPEVFKSMQTLLSFGVGIKDAEKDLLALGNVSQGNADKLQSLTLAFAQTQSAGRLMGQDLLQYVNAGFNPLQTISERWQEFGFKSQRTMGQLRKDMEEGKISADMIRKAFQMATTKGGLFDGMLDKVGKTSFGMKKQLEGQFEAMKIALGSKMKHELNATFSLLSGIVGKVKEWADIPLSSKLREENALITAQVNAITGLNEGSDTRKRLLGDLIEKFPQLFKGIDIEKVKNSELVDILKKVNDEYTKRIGYATSHELKDKYESEKTKTQKEIDRHLVMKELANSKDPQDRKLAMKMRTWEEKISFYDTDDMKKYDMNTTWGANTEDIEYYNKKIAEQEGKIKGIEETLTDEEKLAMGLPLTHRTKGMRNKKGGLNKSDSIGLSGDKDSGSVPSISGGQRITNLVINIDALIKGGLNVHATTVKESTAQIKDAVTETLLTAVNDANLVAEKN